VELDVICGSKSTMVRVIQKRSFWDMFGFFSVCGCNCLDDGVKGAENINKKQDGWKAKHKTFSFSNVLYGGFCNRWKCFLLV
jgi:hypothetical protein